MELSQEKKEQAKHLLNLAQEELTVPLSGILFRKNACPSTAMAMREEINKYIAVITTLIMTEHLVLKHKVGSTLSNTLEKMRLEV